MQKTIETARRTHLERGLLKIDSSYAIISITNPKDREAKLDHLGCRVYRFAFDDCEEFSDFYQNLARRPVALAMG